MSAAEKLATKPDPVEVLTARAEARAYLWREGEFDLDTAADKLQHDAVRDGLVRAIGQDRVQAIMAEAFTAVRADARADLVPDHIADPVPRHRAADSNVEALMFSLRQRGAAALAERDCLRRLAELSTPQVREIIARLIKLRPTYPAVTDELLLALGAQL